MSKRFSKIIPSFFTIKEGSTSHLGLLPSGKKKETALLGAQNRYALRLAGHQSPRQVLRDGTAMLLWRSACNYIAESECMEGACRLSPPELFLIAVSLCTCRRSNEEYYFYSTFERITSGEVPIRVMAEIL